MTYLNDLKNILFLFLIFISLSISQIYIFPKISNYCHTSYHLVFLCFPSFWYLIFIWQRRWNVYERNSDSLRSLRVNMPGNTCAEKCAFYVSICLNVIHWPISSCAACPGSEALVSINYKLCGMCRVSFEAYLFYLYPLVQRIKSWKKI